jgi:hypothetical protein
MGVYRSLGIVKTVSGLENRAAHGIMPHETSLN